LRRPCRTPLPASRWTSQTTRRPAVRKSGLDAAWLEIIQTALDLPAWMPLLALTGTPGSGCPAA